MWLAMLLALQVPTPTEPTAAAAPAVVESAPRLLVLEPEGDSVPQDVRRAIASTLTVEFARDSRFAPLSAADVNQLAELEADKAEAGCDSSGCLAEIAGALGARYVVFGDATQLGELMIVNLSLFDVDTASSIRRTSFEVKDRADIPAQARAAALMLAGPRDASRAGAEQPPPSMALPVTLMASGGAAVLLGLGFDMISPTSNNHALDAFDVVGPAAVIGGAAVVVTGVVLMMGAP